MNLKSGNLKGAASAWLERLRTQYVSHDSKPPEEWRDAPHPSGERVIRTETAGIEVEERTSGTATVVETRYRVRCCCGRRWWALDLSPTTCPRCNRLVTVRLPH